MKLKTRLVFLIKGHHPPKRIGEMWTICQKKRENHDVWSLDLHLRSEDLMDASSYTLILILHFSIVLSKDSRPVMKHFLIRCLIRNVCAKSRWYKMILRNIIVGCINKQTTVSDPVKDESTQSARSDRLLELCIGNRPWLARDSLYLLNIPILYIILVWMVLRHGWAHRRRSFKVWFLAWPQTAAPLSPDRSAWLQRQYRFLCISMKLLRKKVRSTSRAGHSHGAKAIAATDHSSTSACG